MQSFLESLVPNPICFYNKILEKDYDNVRQITKEEFKFIIEYFKNLGIFFPKVINKENYKIEVIEKKDGYCVFNQLNLFKQTTMKIISFDNLLVLDFDDLPYEEIKKRLLETGETFYIYKTFKGYHAYCVSRTHTSKNYDTMNIMYNLGCDPIYISFCKEYGFCVRLSKKIDRNETFVEKFVSILGTKKNKKELEKLLKIKDSLLE